MWIHENRITRRSDLSINDSLSGFDGQCAQQTHFVYEIFYDFLRSVRPDKILEIGTGSGGFTIFLATMCKELNINTHIKTYDIHTPRWTTLELENLGVDVCIENSFAEKYTGVSEAVQNFITSPGATIVLCDGGFKPGEFDVLSNYLKPGDFILAHDYAKNEQYFQENIQYKVWNWMEISYDLISPAIQRNDLILYNENIFEKCAWICATKPL